MQITLRDSIILSATYKEKTHNLTLQFGTEYEDAKEVLNHFSSALDQLKQQNEERIKKAKELLELENKEEQKAE